MRDVGVARSAMAATCGVGGDAALGEDVYEEADLACGGLCVQLVVPRHNLGLGECKGAHGRGQGRGRGSGAGEGGARGR